MHKLTQKFLACGAIFSTFFLTPTLAQAQIQVSPLVIETKTEKGQAKAIIEVKNQSNETFRARVYTVPFTYNLNTFEELESDSSDLEPYLIISPRELVLEAGQTRNIRLTSRFLPSTEEQEYRTTVFVDRLREVEPESANSQIQLNTRMGITVYVRHGNVVPSLTVESAEYNPEENNIVLLVNNSGAASVRPKTQWSLQKKNTTLDEGIVEETTIIAEGKRYVTIPYSTDDSETSTGNYQLNGTFIWGEDEAPQTLPFEINMNVSP